MPRDAIGSQPPCRGGERGSIPLRGARCDMDTKQIVRCFSCGKPYYVYMHYCGDQSLCSACRADLEKQAGMSREDWLKGSFPWKMGGLRVPFALVIPLLLLSTLAWATTTEGTRICPPGDSSCAKGEYPGSASAKAPVKRQKKKTPPKGVPTT